MQKFGDKLNRIRKNTLCIRGTKTNDTKNFRGLAEGYEKDKQYKYKQRNQHTAYVDM